MFMEIFNGGCKADVTLRRALDAPVPEELADGGVCFAHVVGCGGVVPVSGISLFRVWWEAERFEACGEDDVGDICVGVDCIVNLVEGVEDGIWRFG